MLGVCSRKVVVLVVVTEFYGFNIEQYCRVNFFIEHCLDLLFDCWKFLFYCQFLEHLEHIFTSIFHENIFASILFDLFHLKFSFKYFFVNVIISCHQLSIECWVHLKKQIKFNKQQYATVGSKQSPLEVACFWSPPSPPNKIIITKQRKTKTGHTRRM